MNRLQKHAPTLRALSTISPAMCKAVIKAADKDLINTLCECSHNVLKGNVPLTPAQKNRLRRHKRTLRGLVQKQSLGKKKTLLQSGGFLGALLGPVVSLLGGLFGQ